MLTLKNNFKTVGNFNTYAGLTKLAIVNLYAKRLSIKVFYFIREWEGDADILPVAVLQFLSLLVFLVVFVSVFLIFVLVFMFVSVYDLKDK